jgi:non-canonical poly(A) RNA polymerase PAPD5/7
VQRCVHSLDVFDRGSVRVAPFGSFVSGLGTWDSDIDLVITGLLEPDRVTGGFAPADKRKVVKLLQQVANRMRK